MLHVGDVTKINGAEVPKVDVITFGAPCQDLSIAGKRAGMKSALMGDEETTRSGLFFEAIRIIKEMREDDKRNGRTDVNIRPRFAVYENVPGAFSSNHGEDFRAVLEETAKIADKDAVIPGPPKGKWPPAGCIMGDGWSIAWRTHDAQYWGKTIRDSNTGDVRVLGTPQRRRRIALVADFGGETAPEILFEFKSMSGDTEPSGTTGEGAAKNSERCVDPSSYTLKIRGGIAVDSHGHAAGKGPLVQTELSGTLGVSQDQTLITNVIGFNRERCGAITMNDAMPTLQAAAGESGNNQPMVCLNDQGGQQMSVSENVSGTLRAQEHGHQPIVYGISAYDSNAMKSDNPNSGIYEAETSRTLDLNGGNPGCNQGGMAVVCIEGNGSRESHRGDGYKESDTMYTLNTVEQHAVCIENRPQDSRVKIKEDGIVQTLDARMGEGGGNVPLVMEPILLESNQNHATVQTDGVSTSLPASAGMGGGYVPMVAYPEKTTGSLCASGYDKLGTQEALNDMYVVESSSWDGSQVSPTLTANNANGAQRMPDKENFNAIIQGINGDVAGTLDASYYKGCGERQGTERDVVAYGLDRASFNQGRNAQYDFAVDEEKIGTQVAKGPEAVCENGGIYARTQNQVLRLLSETYGAQEVEKWGIAILATLQSSEILQSGMYESSVSSETKNGYKLDGDSLPCSSVVAGWLLRDMRQREECGCSSQGRKPTEQRFEQSDESMPELSQQNPQTCKDLFDMWKKGEGIRLLQQTLYQIKKIRRSVDVPGAIVRRLTPLEAERLQGFPVVRKVRFTKMTKDEYIAWNINEGNIVVDIEYGKVFATRGPGGIKLDKPRELMGTILNGYRVVSIRNGETKMQCRVHRIVWIAEHGIIPDGYVIDHINNDKQDNRLCNLQLLTAAENSTKAKADGLYKIHGDSGSAKITDEVHDFIQYVYGNTDLSIRQLSEIFGISRSRVHQIIHDEPWTDIGEWIDSKGKKHKDADSPRYKALGNSICLPYWQWMANKMVKQLKADGVEHPTMASLFDGIGGFPLVYSRCGCEPIWASEIEEFPIAVTKIRFPD